MIQTESITENKASWCLMEWLLLGVTKWDSSSSFDLLKNADFRQSSRKPDKQMDGVTDQWTDRPSYGDARMHLSIPAFLAFNHSHILIRTNAWPADIPIEGRMGGPMERPMNRPLAGHTLLWRCKDASKVVVVTFGGGENKLVIIQMTQAKVIKHKKFMVEFYYFFKYFQIPI